MKIYLIGLFAVCCNLGLFARVRILTFHCNQSDFIEVQYKTFKKFLSDDFEMIVFNDAPALGDKKEIEEICDQYGIQCIRFEPEWHLIDPLNSYLKEQLQGISAPGTWDWDAATSVEQITQHPSVRHCHVIQYALDHFGYDHDDLVVIMDGDNFLIQPMSFRELLGSNNFAGCCRWPKNFGKTTLERPFWDAWIVFVAFNPTKLPTPRELKFHVDVVKDHPVFPDFTIVDSGGAVYKYINRYPHMKIKEFSWQDAGVFRSAFPAQFQNIDQDKRAFYSNLIEFIDNIYPHNIQVLGSEHFLHFASVSFPIPGQSKKIYFFLEFMHHLLEE